MDPNKAPEDAGRDPNAWLVRVAADLSVHIEDQRQTWGDTDELVRARYVAGLCSDEERLRVEQAMRDFPAVRESIEVIRQARTEIAAERAPVASDDAGQKRVEGRPWTGRKGSSEQEPGATR